MAEDNDGNIESKPVYRMEGRRIKPPTGMKRDPQKERQERQREAERRAVEDAVKRGVDPNEVIKHLRTSKAERMYGQQQVRDSGIYND